MAVGGDRIRASGALPSAGSDEPVWALRLSARPLGHVAGDRIQRGHAVGRPRSYGAGASDRPPLPGPAAARTCAWATPGAHAREAYPRAPTRSWPRQGGFHTSLAG